MTNQIVCINKCCSMWNCANTLDPSFCVNRKTPTEVSQEIVKCGKNLFKQRIENTRYTIKCGLILIDKQNRLLVVQSYNSFWGIPKGSQESDENFFKTCIRETWEETGILLSESLFTNTKIVCLFKRRGLYIFFVCKLEVEGPRALFPQQIVNEITGCGWINISCLKQMIKHKTIRVNYITKFILNSVANNF